jgi:hypothetical protein
MTNKKLITITLALSCAVYQMPLYSGVYKWTDDNGNTHYGSEPPSQSNAEQMGTSSSSSQNPYQSKEDYLGEKEAAKNATEEEKTAAEKAAEEEAAKIPPKPPEPTVSEKGKKVLCAQAKREKKTLLENPRMRDADRSFLSPKQHAQRIARANKEIKEYCR